MRTLYLDASALVKLVIDEGESVALRAALQGDVFRLTNVVGEVETRRAAFRNRGPEAVSALDALFRRVSVLPIPPGVVSEASTTSPGLRTLDALHLASARSIADDLDAFVVYDKRLADAARDIGLPVQAPGAGV